MLIRSTWTLKVAETVTLPRSYYLELMKRLHEKMNIQIGDERIASSTFSPILGKITSSKEFITFHPEEFYQFSLSGLIDSTSKAIASLNLGDNLSFLGANLILTDRDDEITSYEQLYTNWVAIDPEPIEYFRLEFMTPTAFSQQRVYLPLPIPCLMFRSWLERWNNFSTIYLGGDELIGYLQEAIALKYHKIQTRFHPLKKGYVVGFTGKVTLQILKQTDPLVANVANLLVHYAEFSGTGVKTRLGMGKTELNLNNKEI